MVNDPSVEDPGHFRSRCSFCGLDREHVVSGPTPSLVICIDCVALCVEIFREAGAWPNE